MRRNYNIALVAALFLIPHASFSQVLDASKFWIKVYGAPPAVSYMTFGNRVGNTSKGIDTGATFPAEFREQEAPPPPPGFDAVWHPIAPSDVMIRLLDHQFNGWTGMYQIDTFRLSFNQADDPGQTISFKWMSALQILLQCDSLILVYFDPSADSTIRIKMAVQDTLDIPQAGTNGISFVRIFKYGSYLTDESVRDQGKLPVSIALHQNYPNPFNPETKIQYDISSRQHVQLSVYDILGREIATLVDEIQDEGFKSVTWDAARAPSGVYIYLLQAGTFTEVRKMVLMR